MEDLNVAGMIANRRLARAVSDQGFGAARRMLGYKTAREGGTLVIADRWYPSSKKCSACGSVKAKLTLAERTYQCDNCGLAMDRDVNAARNLLSLAASEADSINACGAAVRPGLTVGRAALKQEPGTANAGQTAMDMLRSLTETGHGRRRQAVPCGGSGTSGWGSTAPTFGVGLCCSVPGAHRRPPVFRLVSGLGGRRRSLSVMRAVPETG